MSTAAEIAVQEPLAKKMKLDAVPILRFAKLTEQAFAPVRGSAKAAGFDLRSAYDAVVPAHGKQLIKTDLQVHVPEGSYGRVAPRSGLAVKNFIDVGAGVVDEDYRGNLGVVLFNHADTDFTVMRGDRIAQLICEKIYHPKLEECKTLDETERGASGFGSTGVKELLPANGKKETKAEAEKVTNAAKESVNADKKSANGEKVEEKVAAKPADSANGDKKADTANGTPEAVAGDDKEVTNGVEKQKEANGTPVEEAAPVPEEKQ